VLAEGFLTRVQNSQDFAATLSRIRSHRPNKKKSEDGVKNPLALDVTPEKGPSSKMTLLRKQMEENRLEKLLI
jgi:hypothetical protein